MLANDATIDFMRLRGQAADCEMVATNATKARRNDDNSPTAATGWHDEDESAQLASGDATLNVSAASAGKSLPSPPAPA
jgi:hypothetical protein